MSLSASRRDRYRRIANRVRRIPGEHGLREHSVAIVVVAKPGTYTGDGTRAETLTAITESGGYPPKVRWLNDEEKALGQLPSGAVDVGPITPAHAAGGTDRDLLNGEDLAVGQVRLLRITGPQHPDGADYTIKNVSVDRALRVMIRAVPVGSQA